MKGLVSGLDAFITSLGRHLVALVGITVILLSLNRYDKPFLNRFAVSAVGYIALEKREKYQLPLLIVDGNRCKLIKEKEYELEKYSP